MAARITTATRRSGQEPNEADGSPPATGESWITVGKQRDRKVSGGKDAGRELRTAVEVQADTRQQKPSPRKKGEAKAVKEQSSGKRGGAARGKDTGDGRTVFEQLRKYLNMEAPAEYVQQTVFKLMQLAESRRFQAYRKLLPADARRGSTEAELKEQWGDAIPYRLRQKFEGLSSEWNPKDVAHQERLKKLMKQWVLTDKEQQSEIEDRLRFFHFNHNERKIESSNPKECASYLEAVRPDAVQGQTGLTTEQARLRELCMQPAIPTTILRPRTEDEKRALVMILNHEIEVPMVPPFLSQSMTAAELAVFDDIFMALDYPLYAHVAPGQRFYDNMAKGAILALIHGGPEAASAHRTKIEDFKAAVSRISLDMTSRLLKVSFKGRTTAEKWAGWQVPLAGKTTTLIDYEKIRERSKTTHELVMMDYYTFVVELRKGDTTSQEMYWMLSTGMGLQVQAIEHVVSPLTGVQDKQWRVRVRATACPEVIRNKSHVVMGQNEVVVHHVRIHVNWPCRLCRAPEHHTKACMIPEPELQKEMLLHTVTVEAPPRRGRAARGDRNLQVAKPSTVEELEAFLRTEVREMHLTSTRERASPVVAPKRQSSPTRPRPVKPVVKLALPKEWGQSMHPIPQVSNELDCMGEADKRSESSERPANADSPGDSTAATPLPPGVDDTGRDKGAQSEERNELTSELKLEGGYEFNTEDNDQDMEEVEEKRPVPLSYAAEGVASNMQQRKQEVKDMFPLRGRSDVKRRADKVAGRGNPNWDYRFHRAYQDKLRLSEGRLKMPQRTKDLAGQRNTGRGMSLSPKRRVGRTWAAGPCTSRLV